MNLDDFLRQLLGSEVQEGEDAIEDSSVDPETGPGDEDDGVPSERVYLEFLDGSSAKFYALAIVPEQTTWTVVFNFGRIGYPRAWGQKVSGATRAKAQDVFDATRDEKLRGGYRERLWPTDLSLPGDAPGDDGQARSQASGTTRHLADEPGTLPQPRGAVVGDVRLPSGHLVSIEGTGEAVLWVSDDPVENIGPVWTALAARFPATGLWPLLIDEEGAAVMDERMLRYERTESRTALSVLRDAWNAAAPEDDGFDAEAYAPLGRRFPGLAPGTIGEGPTSIEMQVGPNDVWHLGIVGVRRPADVPDAIGWSGPANYDVHPTDQTVVLRSWEDRFDAYLVGLGADTMHLVVQRPPLDGGHAARIAGEHMAFCPDNIWQGVGTVGEYADGLVRSEQWSFWWD